MMLPNSSQVLIVGDDPAIDSDFIERLAKRGYGTHRANSFAEISSVLVHTHIDIAAFFWLPGSSEHERILKQLLIDKDRLPVVLATPAITAEDITSLLRKGASAVFRLPFASADIVAFDECIDRHCKHAKLFIENQRMRNELQFVNDRLNQSLAELQHDQEAGQRVQARLLPPEKANVGDVEITCFTQASLYLSGDFVDYVELADGALLFYLADVSGHGSSSALLTVLLKTWVQNNLSNGVMTHPFNQLVQKLNEEVLSYGLDQHLTIFMGLISSDRKWLTYVVGGHFPMPVLCQNGAAQFLHGMGSGFPVGLFAGATFEQLRAPLEQNFSLLLCSDGVLELLPAAANDDQEAMLLGYINEYGCSVEGLRRGLNIDPDMQIPDDIAMLYITNAMDNSYVG